MRKLKALPNKASTNAISLNLTGLLSNEAPSVALRYDQVTSRWQLQTIRTFSLRKSFPLMRTQSGNVCHSSNLFPQPIKLRRRSTRHCIAAATQGALSDGADGTP